MPYLLNLLRAGLMFCLTASASLATPEQAELGRVNGFTGLRSRQPELRYEVLISHSWIALVVKAQLILIPYQWRLPHRDLLLLRIFTHNSRVGRYRFVHFIAISNLGQELESEDIA